MRNIIISFLKNISIFDFVKRLYLKFDRVNRYYKRYESKEFRVTYYRKLIDKYLKNITSNNHNNFITQLEKEVNKRSKHLISIQANWWVAFFRVVGSERECKELDKYVDVLQNETLKLPFSRNSSFALLEIYALLIEYGLYGAGCVIRSQCAQAVIQEGIDDKSSQKSLERFFSAAFEENDKDKINSTLDLLKGMSEDNSELLLIEFLLNKINNSHVISKDVAIDKDYLNLIKGKRVAIVGPSQTDTQNGNEIDDFDLVVRFNYKGDDLSSSSKYIGSRTDISYLNGANTWDLENRYKELSIKALKAVVFKVPVNTNLFDCKCARQMLLPLEHCMLDNSPNALPNVISDLLIYQPLEIKIFNIDMQITSKKDTAYGVMREGFYNVYYPKFGHDPFSQFNFIQIFYKNNLIKVDHILKEILDSSTSTYMERLQEIYLDKALFFTTEKKYKW
jgi:hypothetical protein